MRRSRDHAGTDALKRRRCIDRGAVLVETAMVMPLLFALVLGVIDFGSTYNDWISVRQGARDGLREAIVNTKPVAFGGGAWSCPIAGTQPDPGSDAMSLVCYTKLRIGLNQANTRVKIYFTAPYTAGQAVKVCVQYATGSVSGAYAPVLNGKVLSTEVESLIEQDAPTFTAPFAETPIVAWQASCSQL